jgi:transposase-like protein
MILTALAEDLEGSREVLAFRASAEESKDGWCALLQDLRTRGVKEIDLLVTDGHEGLLSAVSDLFPTTLRQRCLVHKQRNVYDFAPSSPNQLEHMESMLVCYPSTNHADKRKENRQEGKRLTFRLVKKKRTSKKSFVYLFVWRKQTRRHSSTYLIDFFAKWQDKRFSDCQDKKGQRILLS